jgi:hypothetical protein
MTKLLRRVKRETLQLHGGRPLVVSLAPEGYVEVIAHSEPGKVRRLSFSDVILEADRRRAENERADQARERRRKRA